MYLEARGLRYDTGFLVAEQATASDVIGYRMQTAHQQIDLYIRDEFWDASKSNPKLGKSQEIAAGLSVSEIHR